MFSEENEAVTRLIVTAIGAGCALIGLIAESSGSTTQDSMAEVIETAWRYADGMAAEFMRRGLALRAQEKSNG